MPVCVSFDTVRIGQNLGIIESTRYPPLFAYAGETKTKAYLRPFK
jgi:hypothetical protein